MLAAVLCWVLAVAAVVFGLVFRVGSMARATCCLLASFLAVAGPVLLLGLGLPGRGDRVDDGDQGRVHGHVHDGTGPG